jgi:hypothetical protein
MKLFWPIIITISLLAALTLAGARGEAQSASPPKPLPGPLPEAPLQVAPLTSAAPSITVEIASPEHFHKRVIALDQPIPVVITNISKQPLGIWRDWCSWGYEQLSFELKDDTGKTWTIHKKEHRFWKNYPDFWTLAAGEPLILNVTLSSDIWETVGGAITDLRGKALTVQAIFTAEPDDQSRENNVWTGRVSSTARVYEIE